MKKFLPLLVLVLLAALIMGGGALAEAPADQTTPTPVPTQTPVPTPSPTSSPTPPPTPTPSPTVPVYEDLDINIHITEESGGEFRPIPLDITEGGAPVPIHTYSAEVTVYEDPTIRVEYHRATDKKQWGAIYYYTDIVIRDPSQIRTAFATRSAVFNPNARLEARGIAKPYNAILAINGDFFAGFAGNGYVLRQGEVYRDTVETRLDLLLIDEDGDFHILTASEDLAEVDKTQIDGKKVINALQFGPALIVDGQLVPDEILNDRNRSPKEALPDRLNQRMCVMQIDKLHYMTLCCAYYGMTVPNFRDLAYWISGGKAQNAFTLDGGNSSQMIFLGRKKNNVQPEAERRPVTDILYFASAWFTD